MMTPKSPIVSLIGISLGAIMGVSLYLSGAFNNPDVNKIVTEYTDKGPSIVKEKIIKTPESLGCTTGDVDCQLSAQIPDYIEYSLTKEEAYGYSSTIFIDEKEVEIYSKTRPDWGEHQCFLTEGYYNAETMEGITGCRSDQDKSIECVVNKNFPDLGMFSLKKTDFYSYKTTIDFHSHKISIYTQEKIK